MSECIRPPLGPSDLPTAGEKGDKIYHLDLCATQLSDRIILVGDPSRARLIAREYFAEVDTQVEHRGLVTVSGKVKQSGTRMSAVTSGMGTSSEEVVLNELFALSEIDLRSRKQSLNAPVLKIIRVGTSGALQSDTELGTAIITKYAIGLDNTGFAYDLPYPDKFSKELEERTNELMTSSIDPKSRFRSRWQCYVSKASDQVVDALVESCENLKVPYKVGITVSNAGFFNNQGRWVTRIRPTIPDVDRLFARLDSGDKNLRVENMEMEASFLHHFGEGNGYLTGTICVVVANRESNTFIKDPTQGVLSSVKVALTALETLY